MLEFSIVYVIACGLLVGTPMLLRNRKVLAAIAQEGHANCLRLRPSGPMRGLSPVAQIPCHASAQLLTTHTPGRPGQNRTGTTAHYDAALFRAHTLGGEASRKLELDLAAGSDLVQARRYWPQPLQNGSWTLSFPLRFPHVRVSKHGREALEVDANIPLPDGAAEALKDHLHSLLSEEDIAAGAWVEYVEVLILNSHDYLVEGEVENPQRNLALKFGPIQPAAQARRAVQLEQLPLFFILFALLMLPLVAAALI